MPVSKMGRRGQTTIPREIREELNLKEGDRIAFVRSDRDIILKPVKSSLLDLRGTIQVTGPQDFNAIRRKVMKVRSEKSAHNAG